MTNRHSALRRMSSWAPWLGTLSVLTAAVTLVGCADQRLSGDDPEVSQLPGDDDATADVIEPRIEFVLAEESDPAIYVITYKLYGDAAATFELDASFNSTSQQSPDYHPMTLRDPNVLSNLAASSDGVEHTLEWDTLADVGYVSATVWVKLQGQGDGSDIPATTFPVNVFNDGYDKPCEIEADIPSHFDGQIQLTYRLSDEVGDKCSVTIVVRITSGGEVNATPSSTEYSDPLEDVSVPPEGIERVFVWDSEKDIGPYDQHVIITFTAIDERDPPQDTFIEFNVYNSSVPDPGDLVISEILPWPAFSFSYIELLNVKRHSLELSGRFLISASDPSITDDHRISPDGSLLIGPGEYRVIGQQNADYIDATVNLYLNPNTDTITLGSGTEDDNRAHDAVTYVRSNYGGTAAFGFAMSVAQDALNTTDNDNFAVWCLEQTLLPGAAEGGVCGVDYDCGSPGLAAQCLLPSE